MKFQNYRYVLDINECMKMVSTVPGFLFCILAYQSLVAQVKIDTFISSHSSFNRVVEGFGLTFVNYAAQDYQKMYSSTTTKDEFAELKLKYIPERLEYCVTYNGWMNPLNIYAITVGDNDFYFTFPSSKYKIKVSEVYTHITLVTSGDHALWKHDGETFKVKFFYANTDLVKTQTFNAIIPRDFILTELDRGLKSIEIELENDLKHKLTSQFVFSKY